MARFFVFKLKVGLFKKACCVQIYQFPSAFSKSSISAEEQCERKAKADRFYFGFIWKRSNLERPSIIVTLCTWIYRLFFIGKTTKASLLRWTESDAIRRAIVDLRTFRNRKGLGSRQCYWIWRSQSVNQEASFADIVVIIHTFSSFCWASQNIIACKPQLCLRRSCTGC